MTQSIMYWGTLIALVGLIWLLVIDILLDFLGRNPSGHDNQQRRNLTERRD
jgi:putative exporter of polyketide antibiotics